MISRVGVENVGRHRRPPQPAGADVSLGTGGGARPIDPTENVLALVAAQAKFQATLDDATARFNSGQADWIIKYFEALQSAERLRVNDLANLKQTYDKQIAETQTTQLKTTSDLVSTQLDKVTTSLSDTINKTADNIASTLAAMDKRVAAVEQFRYETGGKTSISDPALQKVMVDLGSVKSQIERSVGDAVGRSGAETRQFDQGAAGRSSQSNIIAIVAVLVAGLVGGAGVAISVFALASRTPQQIELRGSPSITEAPGR